MRDRLDPELRNRSRVAGLRMHAIERVDNPEGGTELRLRLEPPQLGEIQLRVGMDAQGRLAVQFTASQEAVRRAVEAALPELRQTLLAQGFTLEGLNVAVGYGANPEGANQPFAQEPAPHPVRRREGPRNGVAALAAGTGAGPHARLWGLAGEAAAGHIDLRA